MAKDGGEAMIYLDTSGAMKLVRPEAYSNDLSQWFALRTGITVFSSVLIEVELMRATRRSAPERMDQAAQVLRGIGVVTLAPPVIARAAAYPGADLCSLDAVHLATAEHIVSVTHENLDAFVAYDERLVAAAGRVGLPVASPGMT